MTLLKAPTLLSQQPSILLLAQPNQFHHALELTSKPGPLADLVKTYVEFEVDRFVFLRLPALPINLQLGFQTV